MEKVYGVYRKGDNQWIASANTLLRANQFKHLLMGEAGTDYYVRIDYYQDGKLVCWDTKVNG